MTWTSNNIGTGSGSYTTSGGYYQVTGSGLGVNGTTDSLFFLSQPATGDIEMISYVSSQTNTGAYATAGLMVSDLYSTNTAESTCAFVSVSPQNGINFSYRTTDGGTAATILGPSIATPVWLRIVVSGNSVAGFQSSDGISWQPVGQVTITLPTNYYVGLAVANFNTGSANVADFSETNFNYLTGVVQRSTNLLSWLRADVGLTYASSAISNWQDQSSNGLNGSQSTSANQPTLIAWSGTGAPTGGPAVSFPDTGSGQFLALPAGFQTFTSGASLFAVVRPQALTSGSTILDIGNGTSGSKSNNIGLCIGSTGGLEFYVYDGSTASSIVSSTALSTTAYQLVEAVYSGTNSGTIYVNGTSQGTSSTLQTQPSSVTLANNFIGQVGGGGSYYKGYIAELLVFNTALSSGSRTALESYLLGKYAI